MTLYLPVGPPGCGKSTLMESLLDSGWLDRDAVVSTDGWRQVLTGDFTCQEANAGVFQICRLVCFYRLKAGLDVWYDATNLRPEWRKDAVEMAHESGQPIVSILFTANDAECRTRNSQRERPVPDDIMDAMLEHRREIRVESLPGQVIVDREFAISRRFSFPMSPINR